MSLGFLIIMLAVQPAFSATIQTDLWVYQQGDTVTVTGNDYGSGETVEIVTTDPNGVEVNRGAASADDLGAFTYQFVLTSDVPGIYDVVGTGLTSGLVAATQFDPPNFSHTVNAPLPATVQYSDNVTFSGTFNCVNGNGSNPNCPTSPITATATVAIKPNGGGGFDDVATATSTFTLAPSSSGCPTQCTSPWSVVWQAGRTLSAATVVPGTYDVRVTVTSSPGFGNQQTLTNALTIARENTSATYGGSNSGTAGTPLSLSALVADADGGAGAGNGRFLPDSNLVGTSAVQFQLFNATNTTAVSAIVNANIANTGATTGTPVLTLPAAPGTYQLRTTFLGNTQYAGSSDLDEITVTPADGTPPSGTITINGGAAATNSTTASLRLQATDATGVTAYRFANGASCSSATFVSVTPTTSLDITISPHTLPAGDGTKTICAEFRDAANNVSSPTSTDTIILDTAAPSVAISLSPASPDGNHGWYKSNVTVTVTATDAGSGVDAATVEYRTNGGTWLPYTAPFVVSTDGNYTVDARAKDNATNTGSATQAAFKLDKTAPTVSISLDPASPDGDNDWYVSDVEVTLDATDALSGVDAVEYSLNGGTTWNPYTAPFTISTDGSHTVDARATDQAGNEDTDTISFKLDKTAPSITLYSRLPAENLNGWNKTDVTLTWECTDLTSGVVDQFVSNLEASEGEDQNSTETCSDNAGNTSSDTQQVSIDKTAPTVTFDGQTPAANANGWNNSTVTLDWSCADLLSGSTESGDSVSLTSEGANQSATGTCTDLADNTASDTQTGIDIDLTKPSVAITSITDGSSTIALSVAVSGTKSDSLSGVDSVNVNGYPATLASGSFMVASVPLHCGNNEINATAVDRAGNSRVHTIHITQICFVNMQFYSPLDQSTSSMLHPTTNTGKMGRVIPTKVTFKQDDGTIVTDAVAAARGWTVQIGVNNASCDNGAATDTLETYADAGQSNAGTNLFRWTSGQWMYNLDTGRPPQVTMTVNKCYRLDVYVSDGTTPSVKVSTDTFAIFKPTK